MFKYLVNEYDIYMLRYVIKNIKKLLNQEWINNLKIIKGWGIG